MEYALNKIAGDLYRRRRTGNVGRRRLQVRFGANATFPSPACGEGWVGERKIPSP